MSQARVRKFKRLGLLVGSFLLLAAGAVYGALANANTPEANAADDYAAAGTLKITKNYYESFESAYLLPVNQVYAGDDILYVLRITNISSNPQSRFGSTINIDDELSPDVMSDVHVEDIIINTTWMTQSQIDGACSVNNSYVLHCSLAADLFAVNENYLTPNPLGNQEGDAIEIRIKAKATVHGTSDSYQLHNRAYVYSGDDVDNDGPDCKTLADAKQVERCRSEDVYFCIVMPKIEIDKRVNNNGRVTCYYYPNPENAKRGEEFFSQTIYDLRRDVTTGEMIFPQGKDDKGNTVSMSKYLATKDITELTGSYQSNCMNNDGGGVNYDYADAYALWEEKKYTPEFESKYWIPTRDAHKNDAPPPSEYQLEVYARDLFVKEIVGSTKYMGESSNGHVDDQSVRAGERIEYTLTVRNMGSAVTKGGAEQGIYIYDQLDPLFFDNDNIYVQSLTGGVTCKVEQSKLTCYTDRPLAPFNPMTTERPYTIAEAYAAWDVMDSSEKEELISKAVAVLINECNNNPASQMAYYREQLAIKNARLGEIDGGIAKNTADLATLRKQHDETIKTLELARASLVAAQAAATADDPKTGLIDNLKTQISGLETQEKDLATSITNLEKEYIELNKQRADVVNEIAEIDGALKALETGVANCIDTANLYKTIKAKDDFIAWKVTQKVPVPIYEGEGSSKVCIENCNPDGDPSGYYMNGQYGLGSLPIGDEIVIRVSVIPKQTGEIKNIAYVGGGGDLLCPKDTSSYSYCHSEWVTTFVSAPELHINKELRNGTDADMGTSIVRGTEAKYIIKVTNEGTADTKGMIVIHDVIPEYLEVNRTTLALKFDDASYSYNTGFCEFRGTSSRELYCRAYDTVEGGLLHRSGVWTIEFNVRVLEDVTIDKDHNKVVNFAYVYGGEDPVCNNEQILMTINQAFYSGDTNPYDRCYDYLGHTIVSPKLVVSKGVDKTPTNAGEIFNYWVTVENKGDYATTAETTVLDHLPEGITVNTATLSSGCTYEDGSLNITCKVGAGLKPGHKETFKYKSTSKNLSGQVVNNVTIFNPDDGDCSNDAAAMNTSRCHASVSTAALSPILKIETTASSLEVYKGGQLAYLTTVKNIGNAQTTADTVVTVQMPNELRLLGVRASSGTCRIDLHYFECTIPAGIQAGQSVYISTLTQAMEVTDADTVLQADMYGGGDPDCTEATEVKATETTSLLGGGKVFAADTVPEAPGDTPSDTPADTTTDADKDKETPITTSPDATTPTVTQGGQTVTPAQPDVSTNKRCKSSAGVRILNRPAWASDISDGGAGAPSAGLLSTIQALGTISMLGVASYMVLKSRRDFATEIG
jgi:uncharacterized repeat protein (TIGR01451 family)